VEAHVVYQFRAYTNRRGYARIDEVLAQHRDLYNAALQERKWAWEWQLKGSVAVPLQQGPTALAEPCPQVQGQLPP